MTKYTQVFDILPILRHARVMPRFPAGGFENFSVIRKVGYLTNRHLAKSQKLTIRLVKLFYRAQLTYCF